MNDLDDVRWVSFMEPGRPTATIGSVVAQRVQGGVTEQLIWTRDGRFLGVPANDCYVHHGME